MTRVLGLAPAIVVLVSLCGSPAPAPEGLERANATIEVLVFLDVDGDGEQGAGERGLSSLPVSVFSGRTGMRPDSSGGGTFVFKVKPGAYNVVLDPRYGGGDPELPSYEVEVQQHETVGVVFPLTEAVLSLFPNRQ